MKSGLARLIVVLLSPGLCFASGSAGVGAVTTPRPTPDYPQPYTEPDAAANNAIVDNNLKPIIGWFAIPDSKAVKDHLEITEEQAKRIDSLIAELQKESAKYNDGLRKLHDAYENARLHESKRKFHEADMAYEEGQRIFVKYARNEAPEKFFAGMKSTLKPKEWCDFRMRYASLKLPMRLEGFPVPGDWKMVDDAMTKILIVQFDNVEWRSPWNRLMLPSTNWLAARYQLMEGSQAVVAAAWKDLLKKYEDRRQAWGAANKAWALANNNKINVDPKLGEKEKAAAQELDTFMRQTGPVEWHARVRAALPESQRETFDKEFPEIWTRK